MIRPLRRRHAALAPLFLGLLAPAGLLAGVLSRPDAPVVAGLPAVLAPEPVLPSGRVEKASLTVDGVPVTARTWGLRPERYLQLAPDAPHDRMRAPDVLVYWTPGVVGDPDAPPPDDAVLVGTFGGDGPRSYRLPAAAVEGGSVVLYSLAHRRGLGAAKLAPGG